MAREGHEVEAKHVERGQARAGRAEEPDARVEGERAGQNLILRIEAGEQRHAGDGQRGHQHGPAGLRHVFPQAAHLAHVLLAAAAVNHRPGAEEETCFEEGVRHEVEDRCGERADAGAEKHVAELRDR